MPSDASIYNNVGQGVTPLLNPLDIQAHRNALALQGQSIQQGAQALADGLTAFLGRRRGRGSALARANGRACSGSCICSGCGSRSCASAARSNNGGSNSAGRASGSGV